MKARLPKVYSLLICVALFAVLSGCELARPEGQAADAGPVSAMPPTLAPLGAETIVVSEATAIPTIINVQATAAPVIQSQDQVIEDPAEPVAPTSEPAVELPVQAAAPQESEVAADLVGPAQEETVTEEAAVEENIVVDAPEEDLPIGGPVAANPPGSSTEGGYAVPNYATGASYVVQSGDTLFRIAQQYGTTVEAIIYANGLSSDVIQAGQVLNIVSDENGGYTQPDFGQAPTQPYTNEPSQAPFVPGVGGNYHTVAPGETLFAISSRYGAPIEVIAEANGLAFPYTLGIGQQLVIPAPLSAPYPGNNFGAVPGEAPNPGNFMPGPAIGNHMVAPGETLYAIASQYGAPIEVIAEANGLAYPYTLNIGQQLIIPAPAPYQGNNFGPAPDNTMPQTAPSTIMPGNGYVHSVAPGDNLFGIAQQYGVSVEAIASANGLVYPYTLGVGQPLVIPAPGAYQGPQMAPPNGYYQQPPQGYQAQPPMQGNVPQQPYQGYPAQPPMQGNVPQQPYQGYPAQPPVEGNLAAPINPYSPVPGNAGTHTVAPGETLYSIATRYGTSSDALAAANGLSNPNQLFVGQVLYLP